MKKLILIGFLLLSSLSAQAIIVPAMGYSKNVINCMFNGMFSINFYRNTGMVTYSDSGTINPVNGEIGEKVLTLYGSLTALDPFGANRTFSLVDESNTQILQLYFQNTSMNLVDNTFVTSYSTSFRGSQGMCILLEDAPPIDMEAFLNPQ